MVHVVVLSYVIYDTALIYNICKILYTNDIKKTKIHLKNKCYECLSETYQKNLLAVQPPGSREESEFAVTHTQLFKCS